MTVAVSMVISFLYSVIAVAVMGALAVHFFKEKETKKTVIAGVVIALIVAIGAYPHLKEGIVVQNWMGYLLCVLYSVLIGSVVGFIIGLIIEKLRKVTLLGISKTKDEHKKRR